MTRRLTCVAIVAVVFLVVVATSVVAAPKTGTIFVPDQIINQGRPAVIKVDLKSAARSFSIRVSFREWPDRDYFQPRFKLLVDGWRLSAIGVSLNDGTLYLSAERMKGGQPITPGEHVVLNVYFGAFTGIIDADVISASINGKSTGTEDGKITILPPLPPSW